MVALPNTTCNALAHEIHRLRVLYEATCESIVYQGIALEKNDTREKWGRGESEDET